MYIGSLMTSLRYLKWSIILVFKSNLYLRSWELFKFRPFSLRMRKHIMIKVRNVQMVYWFSVSKSARINKSIFMSTLAVPNKGMLLDKFKNTLFVYCCKSLSSEVAFPWHPKRKWSWHISFYKLLLSCKQSSFYSKADWQSNCN